MYKFKKIFTIIILILLSGCSSTYNLEIKDDIFIENIEIYIDKSEITTENINNFQGEENVELDDQITPFLENDVIAIFENDNKTYKKKVEYLDDIIKVNLSYKYLDDEFSKSNSLNSCFEKFNFNNNKNFEIHAYGSFYCLYSDDMDIRIKTNNKVLSNNADTVENNVYIWHITDNNVDDVDIKLVVEKGFSTVNKIIIFSIVFVIILSAIVFYVAINRKKRNNDF